MNMTRVFDKERTRLFPFHFSFSVLKIFNVTHMVIALGTLPKQQTPALLLENCDFRKEAIEEDNYNT